MCVTTDINAISLLISQLRQKAVSFSWDVLEQMILQVVSFYLENTQLELAETYLTLTRRDGECQCQLK